MDCRPLVGAGWPHRVLPNPVDAVRHAGFTLVEVVTVLLIVGVLAAFALPRLADRYGTDERAFYDQTQAALRYAQKIVLASRRNVCVTTNPAAGTLSLQYLVGAACGLAVVQPGGTAAYVITAPAGVPLAASLPMFQFDSASGGAPLPNATQTVSVGNRVVTIEVATGYVH